MLTHIDIFSGIGGFAIAAQWAGFRTVAFCEIEPYAQAIIKQNFGAIMADADGKRRQQERRGASGHEKEDGRARRERGESNGNHISASSGEGGCPKLYADIRTFPASRYRGATLLTGGFPCQPFSHAGKRKGKEDDRYLWPEMLRVISEARPAWVLGENVAGIVTMELDRVLSDLEGEGYSCQSLIIPACAVDAKHRRDRVWIVGHAEQFCRSENGSRMHGELRREESGTDGMGGSEALGASAVADTTRIQQGRTEQWSKRERIRECGESALHDARLRSSQGSGNEIGESKQPARWLPEPDVRRVAHGISNRVHRLKGLGNAIVPQVAFEIIKGIATMEDTL